MKGQDILLLLTLSNLRRGGQPAPVGVAAFGARSEDAAPKYHAVTPAGPAAEPVNVRNLASKTGLSKSEVSLAMRRCLEAGLAAPDAKTGIFMPVSRNLLEFLIHGLKYAFPAKLGPVMRGIPTAFAAPVLDGKLMSAGELIPVWADGLGQHKGQSIEPLYKTAPQAALKDEHLYALLALVDSIRLGSAREAGIAAEMLKERLSS